MGVLFYGNGHMSVDIHPSFERSVSMKSALAFSENARVMLLAVHPDDDVLAAGGLLQQAAAAGAAIRIIFITDGDNNPWPQRVIERRWRIEAADRVRWGVRRRAEALASLACLGIAAENAVFWGYPDQGLTEILLKESKAIADRIRAEISSWQPTLLVSPSLRDLHPDHNALGVLVRFALKQLEPPPQGLQEISYLVHYKQTVPPAHDLIQCCLLPEQKAIKSKAILCHETQLVLCRRRFLAYATQKEHFLTIADSGEYDTSHPVDRALVAADASLHISLAIRRRFGRFGKAQLYIATDASSGGSACYCVDIPVKTDKVILRDVLSGAAAGLGHYCGGRFRGTMVIPLSVLQPQQRVFVNLQQRYGFCVSAGWRAVPVCKSLTSSIPLILSQEPESAVSSAVCCVVPCYNVASSCGEIVRDAASYAHHIIAIDDGSTDGTGEVLRAVAAELNGRVIVRSFPTNRGKGEALLEGFRYALENLSFEVLVTLDSDRQHRPADIQKLAHACMQEHSDLVIGTRIKGLEIIPFKSRIGNMLAYWLLQMFYPLVPVDTQSGYRAFSRSFVEKIITTVQGGRYETELSMLLLALEKHRKITTVPIPNIYFGNNRSSHFHPVADALRIYRLFCRERKIYSKQASVKS